MTTVVYGQLPAQDFQQPLLPLNVFTAGFVDQDFVAPQQQHAHATILPSQTSAPEPSYAFEQTYAPVSRRDSRQMSHATAAYSSPQEAVSPQLFYRQQSSTYTSQNKRKRSQDEFTGDYSSTYRLHPSMPTSITPQAQPTPDIPPARLEPPTRLPSHRSASTHSATSQANLQTHHHHRLPTQAPLPLHQDEADDNNFPPTLVGQSDMPEPAPRPRGPKLKFTQQDDALLVQLKETKNLTWKQIADFFPGRTSGTLQVRYCTKLKVKRRVWSGEMVAKLRQAVDEYERDRWRIVTGKVGNGFSAAACKDKIAELDGQTGADDDEGEDEDESDEQDNMASAGADG